MGDLVLRVWFLARCDDCRLTLPFDTETDRDRWAAVHRNGIGHQVRAGVERRWREPVIVAGDIIPPEAVETRDGESPTPRAG